MNLGPPNARPPAPCCASSTGTTRAAAANDEAAFLVAWEDDVQRAAGAAAFRLRAAKLVRDEFAQSARLALLMLVRTRGVMPAAYVRRVIQNAVRSAVRRERRILTSRSNQVVLLNETSDTTIIDSADDPTPALAAWVATLPARLQRLYDLLYQCNLTQRATARLLGVSQPRVAQLHATLLSEGRTALMPLIA